MSNYTNIENERVFLIDKNIVSSLTGESSTGYNSIPSKDLLSSIYQVLSNEISAVSSSVEISASNLCVALSTATEELSTFAKLSSDNIFVSSNVFAGNVKVDGSNISVINGNYFLTTTGSHVVNYSSKNSFVQAECNDKYKARYGIAATGTMGYCILSVSPTKTTIKLSGDINALVEAYDENHDLLYSFSLGDTSLTRCCKITGIDPTEKTVVVSPALEIQTLPATTEKYIELWETDDNAFYCPKRPEVGNVVIPAFYGNHIEGAATKAILRCTHAEGRNTIADVRYSHAEGTDTIAGGMASHAEGGWSIADGRYSHAEGISSYANGTASHAAGISATVNANYAYGWSGGPTCNVPSDKVGTYNIYPIGGVSGFIVSGQSLCSIIGNEISSLSSSLTAELSGATVVTELSNAISSLSNVVSCNVQDISALSDLISSISSDSLSGISTSLSAKEVALSVYGYLHTIREQILEDPILKDGIDSSSSLEIITRATILMFKALSSFAM